MAAGERLRPTDPSPWAIVGTGPSLNDLWDPHGLLLDRRVVVVNAAIAMEWVIPPDIAFLHDAKATHLWLPYVKEPTRLVANNRLTQWGVGLTIEEQAAVRNYPGVYLFADPQPGGTLPQVMAYLLEVEGADEIELYGYDFNEPHYQDQIKPTVDLILKYGPKVTNCCPSTVLDMVPVESRPWTLRCGT